MNPLLRSAVAIVVAVVAFLAGGSLLGVRTAGGALALPADGPARVKTWYYYGLNDVNANVPPEIMARYAEFVEDDGGAVEHATKFKRAGGRYAVSYTDPAYVPYCFPPFVGTRETCRGQVGKLIHDEGAWFHGRDGTRVRRFVSDHFGYQQAINPASQAARNAWRQTTEEIVRNGPIDLFYADDSGGPLHARDMSPKSSEFYDFNDAGVEITSDDVFRDQWIAYLSYAVRPLILNGNDPTYNKPSYGGAFLRPPFVWGAAHEGCFRPGRGPVVSEGHGDWLSEEDGLLAETSMRKYAICLMLGTPEPEARIYALASWWLTYDPQWSVAAPIDPVPGGSSLLPEYAIVPGYPLRTPRASAAELRTSTGAYLREFAGCYVSGKLIGGCAAVVNPSAHDVAMPPTAGRYAHALTVNRPDLLHGGRADWIRGTPQRIAAASAAILAR